MQGGEAPTVDFHGPRDRPPLSSARLTADTGFQAAQQHYAYAPHDAAFGSILTQLRAQGYDVWMLTFHPVCSTFPKGHDREGESPVPNHRAEWAMGGEDFCKLESCACEYPSQPVDNYIALNAVVMAYATKQAKQYGDCADDADCAPAEVCDIDACLLLGDCQGDDDCPGSMVCDANRCHCEGAGSRRRHGPHLPRPIHRSPAESRRAGRAYKPSECAPAAPSQPCSSSTYPRSSDW